MKKISIYCILLLILICFSACNDWLDRDSKSFIDDNEAYSNKSTVTAILANLYNRLPDTGAMYQGTSYFTDFDEAMAGNGQNNIISYKNDYLHYYDYDLIRDINTYLSRIKNVTFLTDEERRYYVAEGRFLRVYVYFELVKRMGGVPLITDVMVYDPKVDITSYQIPRSKEYELYDFIASEVDEIADDLDLATVLQYNRASKGAALALKCRAMLYAGSLAKYNSLMVEPLALPNGEVGIPVEMADKYYKQSLKAAQDLINLSNYGLYNELSTDKQSNFYNLFIKSPASGNKEAIFIKEYKYPMITHDWTAWNLPRTFSGGGDSGNSINPSLNLIDAFENLDGTDGKLQTYVNPLHEDETTAATNNCDSDPSSYIYYKELKDIFNNKDNRLFGTVMIPGSMYNKKVLDTKAGIAFYNNNTGKFLFYEQGLKLTNPNEIVLDGVAYSITGYDGPSDADYITRSGFYIRKYMDETATSSGSGVAFIRYRYGEILLNAAEAAVELGGSENEKLALGYINQLRERAGFTKNLESITLDRIRNERRVELAFEGHRYYDLRRWRIAEELFDGNTQSKTAMLYGLWPYQVYRPGHATHGQWIFMRRLPAKFRTPRKFVRANYYSAFTSEELTRNPKLVKNPGH